MRALAIGAFVVDGAASVGFVALMALGEGRITPRDAIVLSALLVGFFSALATLVLHEPVAPAPESAAQLILSGAAMFDRLPEATKRDVRQHFPASVPLVDSLADPAHHLELLTHPWIDAGALSSRVQ